MNGPKFVIEQDSEEMMSKDVAETPIATQSYGPGEYLTITYDTKTAGESKTHPSIRTPPNKPVHQMKMIQTTLKALNPAGTDDRDNVRIPDHVQVHWFDSCKHGNLP